MNLQKIAKIGIVLVALCLVIGMSGEASAQEIYKVTFHENWVPVLDAAPMAKFSWDNGQTWTNWTAHDNEDAQGNYYWDAGLVEPDLWIVLCPSYLEPVDPATQTVQEDGDFHSYPWEVIDWR